jgi:transposase
MQIQENVNKSKLYIGLDIHKKSWSVTIRTDIMEHKTFSMADPLPEQLYQYIEKTFPDYETKMAYEAGCCGFSAGRYFSHLGWDVCMVNPADVPIMHKQQFQKTDKIDSRNLCKQLQMGNLTPIHIPQEDQEQFRSLLRFRMQIAKDLRRIKTQIKSALLFHGIKIPEQYDNSHWTIGFITWIEKIEWSNVCGKSSMARKLEMYQFTKKQYLNVGTELRAYAKKTYAKNYELLKSIPGIGGFTAAAFLAEIGDFSRFSNEVVFSSFIGVVPGIYNSGGTETNLGVTPRANHILRTLLVESVWVAVSKDPEIQAYYKTHVGKNVKSIVIKIAHKMARRIFAVIKTQTPYRINKKLVLDKKIKLPDEANEIINEPETE